MRPGGSISIWFFIGISLLVNGLLIMSAGVYEVLYPPHDQVVLFHVHANVWWGGLLFLLGAAYCYYFAPNRKKL
jgi:uncharacterized BrkB/YihY/UPF0761 family membrane protein